MKEQPRTKVTHFRNTVVQLTPDKWNLQGTEEYGSN